jgi:hypothetical protein
LYNDILHNNFLKAFLLSFIILNYPIIFDYLLNKFKDKKKIIHIFKLIFIALSLILLLNWALFDMTFLLGEKYRIYSFYDYYPITFTILYIIFFNFYKKFISFENIYFIILLLLTAYLSQSRIVLFSNILFLILLIIINIFIKFNKNNKIIEKNNKFFFNKINIFLYFYIIIIFSFFYAYVNFFDFISHYSFFLTIKYRYIELFNFIEILNIKNFFLPFISEHENFKLIPTESFHNQFLEIYYHMGFFSIIIVISLYDLIKKVHENNLINLYLLLIFFLPILFFMTPFSHLYSCTIFIFSLCFLKLNYKRIN